MAARYNLKQTDACRDKIQVSQLINRLQDHVFKGKEMSATQLRAAEILLDRKLPRLAQTEQTITQVQPFAVLPNEIKDIAAWEQSANPQNTEETQH